MMKPIAKKIVVLSIFLAVVLMLVLLIDWPFLTLRVGEIISGTLKAIVGFCALIGIVLWVLWVMGKLRMKEGVLFLIYFDIVLIVITVGSIIAIIMAIITVPCNHIGDEPQIANVLYIFNIIVASIQIWRGISNRTQKILVYVLLATNILAVIGMILIENFNILLQYDRWCRKGMPARPF